MGVTDIFVPEGSLSATDCKGLADVLASVGDKWTIMVVGALSKGSLRYNEIQRRVSGISQRMLTLTLKRLETDGIVLRTLFASVPPRVDYELTELRQTSRGALVPLRLWPAKNTERSSLLTACTQKRMKNPLDSRTTLASWLLAKGCGGYSKRAAGA